MVSGTILDEGILGSSDRGLREEISILLLGGSLVIISGVISRETITIVVTQIRGPITPLLT